MRNIAEMLRLRAIETPDTVAVSYENSQITWRELYTLSAHLGEGLRQAGVCRGDIVGIYAHHTPAQVVAIFAIAMSDAAFSVINPLLKEDQVKHQVQDASMKAVIGAQDLISPLESFFADRRMIVEIVRQEGSPVNFQSQSPPSPELDKARTVSIPTDVSNIFYTSGSTGRPKGVVTPHRTLLDGARIVSGYLGITMDDVILSILPFGFDYGLNQLLTCVYTGAKLVMHRYVMPTDLIDVLSQERITGMAAVPTLWPNLLLPRFRKNQQSAFPHLRYITTAGGFHTQELLRSLVEFFPNTEIVVMYGLTESFRSTYLPFGEIFKREGSIGKAVPEVEILVLDSDGNRCKPYERGELIHRGAFVSYGYLNNPELTKQKFVELGTGGQGCLPEYAVRSGDQVSLDEDGFIYFHGRMDMQIKSSGYRISPDEVTEAVLSIPDVSQAFIFGLPDDRLGESVNVAYSTYSGHPLDPNAVRQRLQRRLPSYAVPKHLHFYERLPLNLNGKIDWPAIKRHALGKAGEGTS